MKGYIYIIQNNFNDKKYIGQTIGTIESRFSQHKSDAITKRDSMYLHNSMRIHGVENFYIQEIESIEADTKHDLIDKLNELEVEYIAEYNTLAPNGYNLSIGGGNFSNIKVQIKVDEYDLYGNFIKTYDSVIDATRSVGSNCNSAILKCCTGKSKFAFHRLWRYHSDDLYKYSLPNDVSIADREYKAAPVNQYTKAGKFVQSFDSITDTMNKFNNTLNMSHISECCRGLLCTSGGFVWRYKGEPFDKYKDKKDKRERSVKVFNLNGEYINQYSSIKEACEDLNLKNKCHITSCCQNKRKSAYGYKWQYVS